MDPVACGDGDEAEEHGFPDPISIQVPGPVMAADFVAQPLFEEVGAVQAGSVRAIQAIFSRAGFR